MKFGSITTPIVTDGLVFNIDAANRASYPKSGTTWFDTISSNNASLVNGPIFNSNNDGSIDFDGSDDYTGVDVDILFPNTQHFSIGCFLNIASSEGDTVWGSNDGSGNRLYFGIRSGYWDIGYGGTAWVSSTTDKQALVEGWNHIVLTVTNGLCKIYINSIANTRTITDQSVNFSSGYLYPIGSFFSSNSYSATYSKENKVASFRVYNRGLSSTEVLHNYNALKSRFGL